MKNERWIASGRRGGVTCSTPEAAEAGLEVVKEGGSAVDAYLAACFVQAVFENGSTTVAGVFSVNVFESGRESVEWVAGVYGPAAAEDYENYNGRTQDRFGGRGMPAPGCRVSWPGHGLLTRSSGASHGAECSQRPASMLAMDSSSAPNGVGGFVTPRTLASRTNSAAD
jgi:hypothetical protein